MLTMRDKPAIQIAAETRARAVASIRRYFADELELEIGEMKAGFVFDYFVAELGPVIYNQAIADARAFFDERSADLAAICYRAEFEFWDQRRRESAASQKPSATTPKPGARRRNS